MYMWKVILSMHVQGHGGVHQTGQEYVSHDTAFEEWNNNVCGTEEKNIFCSVFIKEASERYQESNVPPHVCAQGQAEDTPRVFQA